MENAFLDFFKKIKGLSLGDLQQIYSCSKVKSYKAGEIIAAKGDHFNYSLGIVKGIIRTYVITSAGDERTVRIVREGGFSGCAACMLEGKPSFEFLEAVEDTYVISLNNPRLLEIADDNLPILKFWNRSLMDAFAEAVHRIQFFVTLTPEERYKYLLEQDPELLNRVPQKYLASYIGVTTVSLSRIRARQI